MGSNKHNYIIITIIYDLGLHYCIIRFLSAEKDKEKIQEGFFIHYCNYFNFNFDHIYYNNYIF